MPEERNGEVTGTFRDDPAEKYQKYLSAVQGLVKIRPFQEITHNTSLASGSSFLSSFRAPINIPVSHQLSG